MSNAAKFASILKKLADAHYQAADELLQLAAEQPGPVAVPAASAHPAPADSFDSEDFTDVVEQVTGTELEPQGSAAVCPKHRKPYKDGKFGPYCTQPSDDPAWSNSKGYCTITPKNAAQYLRVKAAA